MKRILFVGGLVAAFLLVSCKKTYVCVCTEFYNGADTSWTDVRGEREFEYRKEKDAAAECDKLDGETQTYMTEEYGLNCELK